MHWRSRLGDGHRTDRLQSRRLLRRHSGVSSLLPWRSSWRWGAVSRSLALAIAPRRSRKRWLLRRNSHHSPNPPPPPNQAAIGLSFSKSAVPQDNKPLPGAAVWVQVRGGRSRTPTLGRTDAAGRYTIELGAGFISSVTVVVAAEGHVPKEVRWNEREPRRQSGRRPGARGPDRWTRRGRAGPAHRGGAGAAQGVHGARRGGRGRRDRRPGPLAVVRAGGLGRD